jgi:hypothetical protein
MRDEALERDADFRAAHGRWSDVDHQSGLDILTVTFTSNADLGAPRSTSLGRIGRSHHEAFCHLPPAGEC